MRTPYLTTRDLVDMAVTAAVILALVACVIHLGVTGRLPFGF